MSLALELSSQRRTSEVGEERVGPSTGSSTDPWRGKWFRKEDVPAGTKVVVDTRKAMTEKSWVENMKSLVTLEDGF